MKTAEDVPRQAGSDPINPGSPTDRRSLRGGIVLLAVVAVFAVVAVVALGVGSRSSGGPAVALGPHADASIPGSAVTVGTDVCGAGWNGGEAGSHTFAFWNNSIQPLEVYVESITSHRVFLDVENLGAGVTRSYTVTLRAGRYRFSCMPADADPVTGPTWSLTGTYAGRGTPGLRPVTVRDLIPALGRYETWVRGQLPSLQRQTQQLADDVRRGDRVAAERDWLIAHDHYQTLGAAYDAFGSDGDAIDRAPPAGESPAEAARDPALTGFPRVEAQLWSGAPLGRTRGPADALVRAVRHLRHDMVNPVLSTTVIGLRAHEILEDAITHSLTGEDDLGSRSDLAVVDANLTGTREALRPLLPLLRSRDPHLGRTLAWIARSQRLVRSFHAAGHWRPLQGLSRSDREHLDADLSQTAELLSQVAVITDPRRSN